MSQNYYHPYKKCLSDRYSEWGQFSEQKTEQCLNNLFYRALFLGKMLACTNYSTPKYNTIANIGFNTTTI
ncbi:hypothetical protein RhiirA4_481425 [Rhizophagus irregularis]|uniref:Uncharacterized protein n=1 Tax=Rhizophagus irregularis TaxID=588596 RepID=A0A2I1HJF4_9GLOM|nr:hypothetical protein RhiirA4_481425 [Rhizophagus irregularis]